MKSIRIEKIGLADNKYMTYSTERGHHLFLVSTYDEDDDIVEERALWTNGDGEGLFEEGKSGEERQVLGTSQFYLPDDHLIAIKRMLRHLGLRLTPESAADLGIKAGDIIARP